MTDNTRIDSMQQRQINVVILTTEYPPRVLWGLGTHVSELAPGLSRIDCRVTVIAPTPGEPYTTSQPNLTVRWVSAPKNQRLPTFGEAVAVSSAQLALQIQKVIENLDQPQSIIHCHDWWGFPVAQQVASAFKIPVVATVHSLYAAGFKWGDELIPECIEIEKNMCHRAAIITVSHSMQELIHATYAIPRERVRVVYNGIDPKPFMIPPTPSEAAQLNQMLSRGDRKIILFAGRLAPVKGIEFLLESAAEVIARYPNVLYVIAGSSADLDAGQLTRLYRSRFPKYQQLWSRLKFLGKVSRRQLASLYHLADIALVPSVYEAFGYAAAEAMAARVPVIATCAGGLAEVVISGETGLLVPVHTSDIGPHRVDVDKLTEAQLFLLNNDETARRMGQAGRERVLSKFNLEQMAYSVRMIYGDVLSGAGAG